MRWRIVAAAAAGLVTVVALAAAAPAQAEPARPGAADRMDAAVRAAAGFEPARSGKGVATPLRTDGAGRAVVYVEGAGSVDGATLRAAVAAAGGEVTGGGEHRLRAAVPPDRLAALAGTDGVLEVRRPDTAVPMAISEGVQPSGALAWHDTGRQGAGVKVGIIDVGFGRLEATQANGELPANVTVHNGSCGTEHASSHGTTVAEVVHDMAPQADLYLACIADTIDFAAAGRWLAEQGVRVVNVSLGFPGTGRGDGVPDVNQPDWSPATVVAWLRGQGIVVVAAAGNEAQRHWTGTTVDPNQDGWVNISGNAQNLGFSVPPGGTVKVELKWDAWPLTNEDLDLYVMAAAHAPTGPNDPDLVAVSQRAQQGTPGGLSPVELPEFTNPGTTGPQTYWLYVKTNGARTDLRYDLTLYGPAQGLSWNAPAGSVAEPATSPAVLAVGGITPESAAVDGNVVVDSSRGPTIDGRIKPDLTGFTGVTTFTDATATGTSIAAAHVSGAAALYLSANPDLDPGELEALLLDSSTRPGRGNTFGYGVLQLGAARDPQPYRGDGYTPLQTPQRKMSFQRLAAGETVTVRDLPTAATAVVLSVHGQDPAALTNLQVFADTPTEVNTVELAPRRSNQAVVAVTMHPRDRVVRVRTTAAAATVTVDLLGYFSPGGASSYFPLRNPVTLLDTRTWGIASPKLGNNEVQTIQVRGVAGVPGNATAAVVNVTAADVSASTSFDLYADNQHNMGTLSAAPGDRMTKLTIVPIGSDGAIRIRSRGGEAHAEMDLVGWFASGDGARYVPLLHTERILDTATGTSVGAVRQFQTGNAFPLRIALQRRVPAAISAAWLAVRATTASTAPTSIGTWAAEYPWQGHDQLAAQRYAEPSSTQTNSVLTPLGASGTVGLRNSLGATDLSVALQGYFVGGEPVAAGALPAPTGFWRFDETAGDTAADASGNGHMVTMQGDSSWVSGRMGQAAWLDGSTGWGTTTGPVLRTDQSFSVSAWVYKEGSGGAAVVAQEGSGPASAFLLENIGGDRWSFSGVGSANGGTSPVWRAVDPQPTRPSEWTHLVGVYDAAAHQLRLYVNGALATVTNGVTLWNATGALTIGAGKWNGNRAGAFDGGIDDVRTYDRPLADSEVRRLHGDTSAAPMSHWRFDEAAGTRAADSLGRSNDGTLHGGTSWPPGVFGHAVSLDGSSGYVQTETSGVNTKDSFTITAWAYLTDRKSHVVVSQDGTQMTPFHMQYSPGFDRWVLSGRVSDTANAAGSPIALGARSPELGRWTHLTAVYDAGRRQFRLYVDGELEGVAEGVTTWDARGPFTIGRALNRGNPTGFFKGAIDDVRAYQGLLTDEQIRALATR